MRRLLASSMMIGALAVLHQGCGGESKGAPQPITCTMMGCVTGLGFETRLDATQDLGRLRFTVCRNGACATAWPAVDADGALPLYDGCKGDPKVGCLFRGRADGAVDARVGLSFEETSAVDGDTAAFRMEDTTKPGALVDVVRQVSYAPIYINGAGCPAACKVANTYVTPASVSNIRCAGNVCTSGATFHGRVTLVGRPKTLVACRNTVCVEAPAWWDSHGGYASFHGPFEGWSAFLVARDATSADLTFDCPGLPDEMANGDHYTLQGFVSRVVDYETSYPNGQACDTLPCTKVDVTLL